MADLIDVMARRVCSVGDEGIARPSVKNTDARKQTTLLLVLETESIVV